MRDADAIAKQSAPLPKSPVRRGDETWRYTAAPVTHCVSLPDIYDSSHHQFHLGSEADDTFACHDGKSRICEENAFQRVTGGAEYRDVSCWIVIGRLLCAAATGDIVHSGSRLCVDGRDDCRNHLGMPRIHPHRARKSTQGPERRARLRLEIQLYKRGRCPLSRWSRRSQRVHRCSPCSKKQIDLLVVQVMEKSIEIPTLQFTDAGPAPSATLKGSSFPCPRVQRVEEELIVDDPTENMNSNGTPRSRRTSRQGRHVQLQPVDEECRQRFQHARQ